MASVQGWGRETWGSGAWGEYAPFAVTGNGLTSSTNNVTVVTDQVITVTAEGLTSTAGDAVATGIAIATPEGVVATWQPIGTYIVQSDYIFPITGTSATSSEGDVTTSVEIRAGWNRSQDITTGATIGWGDQQWGASGGDYALTGEGLTASTNDLTITTDQILSPTGTSLTASIGTYAISAGAEVTIVAASEPELDASTGEVAIAISPTVEPTGQLATVGLGDVGTSVFVTGTGLTSSEGDVTQETSYLAPSEEAAVSVGTLNVQIDVTFTITGVSATSSIGTLYGTMWSVVDDSNSSISWTEVNKAA
jgi:hypothetical protein